MKATPAPLGKTMDDLGVSHATESGDTVRGAMVLLQVVDKDGCVALDAEWSPGLSWLERIGMLREAERAEHRRQGSL